MSEWFEYSFRQRKEELNEFKRLLRITVYGSFSPPAEKQILLGLVDSLRSRGYEDTDIVEGPKRPNRHDLDSYGISILYLEESDVNYLVFTLHGYRMGVTTELAHLLENPRARKKLSTSVIFIECQGELKALGTLQESQIENINDLHQHVNLVEFETMEELFDSAQMWAASFCKLLGPILETRMP